MLQSSCGQHAHALCHVQADLTVNFALSPSGYSTTGSLIMWYNPAANKQSQARAL